MRFHTIRDKVAVRGIKREPLKTISELAEEFGLTVKQLEGYMQHHFQPKAEFDKSICFGKYQPQRSYYKPSVMRAWWKTVQEKLKEKQK